MFALNLKFLDHLLDRRRALTKGAAVLLGLGVLILGAGDGVDRLMRGVRDSIRTHDASGEIHIVEMDARSLQQLDRWPWPRRHHAQLIDRLHDAGARSIAFDVDFSALSNPIDDGALAASLERAGGGVILPTLRQREATHSSNYIDNVPARPFIDNAFLASVNVVPDPDGYVRHMLLGVETAGVPRPSLASMVAERQSEIGRSFEIDYSIDPASIPRHGFIDVMRGDVPAEVLRGKRIIVGATAVEIWDRYSVPNHGVIPGVVIQALAAETLMSGAVPASTTGLWALLLAIGITLVAMRGGSRAKRIAGFAMGSGVVLALPLATEYWLALSMPLAPALATLATAGVSALGFHFAERFRERSRTDQSTGLPNLASLEMAAADARTTIVVARIDRFAALAAGLGADATVNLIHRVADRLRFGHDRTIYRIDEGSLAWTEDEEESATLPQRLEALIALMRSPVDCGRLVDVALSFGVADPIDAGAKQQVANASLAAVHAVRLGTRWERYAEGESEETSWHLSLLGELDAAMAAGQVWNAYQPKLDIRSGRIVGVEALVRWDHPQRGAIRPDQFIPLVEEHGRARDLTFHVFDGALADALRWRSLGHDLVVAVNVSATLLLDDGFVGLLRERLERAALPPDRITIEVTESAAMDDPDRAIAALESWRALGVNISIDDYGTGQSSLGYLQKLPANELKIDMSFVKTLVSDRRNAIMVRSTIAMAHELGMKVVAEGIEDADCLALLTEMGCDTGQGWHIGKPMPSDAFVDFLGAQQKAAA
jgi:diguanylate cyclase